MDNLEDMTAQELGTSMVKLQQVKEKVEAKKNTLLILKALQPLIVRKLTLDAETELNKGNALKAAQLWKEAVEIGKKWRV